MAVFTCRQDANETGAEEEEETGGDGPDNLHFPTIQLH